MYTRNEMVKLLTTVDAVNTVNIPKYVTFHHTLNMKNIYEIRKILKRIILFSSSCYICALP